MGYFNWVFVDISMAVVFAVLMPCADTLPHGEGHQVMQHQGYDWHHEQEVQGLLDPQKNGQETWHREHAENAEKWLKNLYEAQRQESSNLPDKKTTAQQADLQNKRSEESQRLQRWQINKEKYRQQEEVIRHDETQRQEEWQGQQQNERKYEQQEQENLNWQQSEAIPPDSRRQYSRWKNIPKLHDVQAQPIPDNAHRYYYPNDEQIRYYHQQGEWPRAYSYQAPASHREIYHSNRDFFFPPGYPQYDTDKNAYIKRQQTIYDKEGDSKVPITHIPLPNTTGSKLIPLPFPNSVANVRHIVGSQMLNEEQKLMNSNIQLVNKRQDGKGSDADSMVENLYQQDLKPRPQLRQQPKQSFNDKEITGARIKSKPLSEPESVNDQSRLIADSKVKYNNLNEIQEKWGYRLTNRQLPREDTNEESENNQDEAPVNLQRDKTNDQRNSQLVTATDTSTSRLKMYRNRRPGQSQLLQPNKEKPKDISSEKQQSVIPQEQENKPQRIPTTDSNDGRTFVVGQTNDQNEDRKPAPQKTESNEQVADERKDTTQSRKYRRKRRRQRKPTQQDENSKQIEMAIEEITTGDHTTVVNSPADKLFDNSQQLRKKRRPHTQSTEESSTNKDNENEGQNLEETTTKATNKIQSMENMESTNNMQSENISTITKINDELNDKGFQNNYKQEEIVSKEEGQPEGESEKLKDEFNGTVDHKTGDDSKESDDQNTKKVPDDDNSLEEDELNDDDDNSKHNEDQKSEKALDDDDDSIDGVELNDDDDDLKDTEDQNTKNELEDDNNNDDEEDFIDEDEPNDADNDFNDNEDQKTKKINDDKEDDSDKDESEITAVDAITREQNEQDGKTDNPKEFMPPDEKDNITTTTLAPTKPIENVWYSIVDYYFGGENLKNNDKIEDEILTIDIANILAAEIISNLIPSKYANTVNFIRIIGTNAMRGRDGMKDIIKEPVIKDYVSQITEKIIPLYLKVKTFIEPQDQRDCKVNDDDNRRKIMNNDQDRNFKVT